MSKIDSRLKFLKQQTEKDLTKLEASARFALEVTKIPSPRVKVLLQYSGSLADVEKKGFVSHTVAGDVASGTVELNKLDQIAALENVVRIESSRPLTSELDNSIPEIRADVVHIGPPGHRGSGVIVGIIDSGIDFTHECFRRADGTSRILAIWDQLLSPTGSESSPAGYTYGVEYTKTDIDAALTAADPFSVVRHKDRDTDGGHGTHVSGIAAGDGSVAGNGQPAFTFVGVAPEAHIIVVANRVTTEALGDSASTLDAVQYIFSQAAALGKPVVINQSQGDNLGPHDGTSLLERGIDNLLGGPGKAIVKSAGNAADDDIHASGTVTAGGTERVQFVVPAGDTAPDTLDIWYSGSDRFALTVTPPGGAASAVINPGTSTTINLPNGNRAWVDSVLDDPNNHDNRIYIQLSPGTSPAIQQGTWAFTLQGNTVVNGRFDAWIERGRTVPRFIAPHLDNSCTISVPGTSHEIISVGSYIIRGTGVGNISVFSSLGPTRDGRQKPDISAPGEWIMSARAQDILHGTGEYHLLLGTSMAAPHVAGVIALMLQKNKILTQAQIKKCLTNNARSDAFTGAVPNNTWGYGKLDAKAAFDCKMLKLFWRDPKLPWRDPKLPWHDPKIAWHDPKPIRRDPKPIWRDPKPILDPKPSLDPKTTLDPKPSLDPKPTLDPKPSHDPFKRPNLDRPAGGVGRPPLMGPKGRAPFALATPHHALAGIQSNLEMYEGMIAEYDARIKEYETVLSEMQEAMQQGRLTATEADQYDAIYQEYMALLKDHEAICQEYEALLREYQELTQRGQ